MPNFVILHLSDAQIGNPKHGRDSYEVLQPLLDDVRRMAERLSIRPDLIVFSGDLAYGEISGATLPYQYDQVRRFIDSIYSCSHTSFDDTPILIVPGNHDLNRALTGEDQASWITELDNETGPERLYREMQTSTPLWRRLLERQDAWSSFVRSLPAQRWQWFGQLCCSTGTLRNGERKIGVVGLNSSWASTRTNEKGLLWIGRYQFQAALDSIAGTDFKIAVAHHPLSWLNPYEETWMMERLESSFQLFMHGHDHNPWIRPIGRHLVSAAGPCYQGAAKGNSYSWILLDLDSGSVDIWLRQYSSKGSEGWIPLVIPGRTTDDGLYALPGLFDVAAGPASRHQAPTARATAAPSSANFDSPRHSSDELIRFINFLADSFLFRWEPASYRFSDIAPVTYWPVRLRRPTPIHAVQAFAAAGLQSLGVRVVLWLDDLGTRDYPVGSFRSTVRSWFRRAGGDDTALDIRLFSEALATPPSVDIWPLVHRWLGSSDYRLEHILKVAKLLPQDVARSLSVEELIKRRPRRLLTPPMVWSCLVALHNQEPPRSLLTLGGYDERPLWQAWRECSDVDSLRVGHLYVPEVTRSSRPRRNRPLHMSERDLAWTSKEEIHAALSDELALGSGSIDWSNPNELPGWCLRECVLLPIAISGGSPSLLVDETRIVSPDDLGRLDQRRVLPALVEALARWLL